MPPASSLLPALVARIAALQVAESTAQYPAGLFPSQRLKPALGYRREDANGFFAPLTVFTLQELAARLPPASRALVAGIARRAAASYPLFCSRDGLDTYNFYPTRPRRHFPGGWLLHRSTHFAPPDDLDCTALVYLTQPRPPAGNAWLHAKLQAHANTVQGWAATGPRAFRRRPVYSTWFGRRMPIDFDACTLANGLLWVLRSGLPLGEFDHGSLAFIEWAIASGAYRRQPFLVSTYYATTPLLAYHVGRLAAEAPALAATRATLLAELPPLLAAAPRFMDQLLLASTLLRLGGPAPPPLLGAAATLAEVERRSRGLSFFIAPLLSYLPATRWLAGWRLSHIEWECPAHSLALVAEYLALGGQ